MLSLNIKRECFLAFIHSRLIGKGAEEEYGVPILNEEKLRKDFESFGDKLVKKIGSIATLDSIQKKIDATRSKVISDMYYKNYSNLSSLLEHKIKKGEDIVNSLIGLSLLSYLLEKDNNEKMVGINTQELTEFIAEFETKSEDNRNIVTEMQKVATFIGDKYWNK